MKYTKLNLLIFLAALFLVVSCDKDEDKSKLNDIEYFKVLGQLDSASINKETKEINVVVNNTANLKSLTTEIKLSESAKVEPASGAAVDFSSNPTLFVVTAEDGTKQEWKVFVSLVFSNLNNRQVNAIACDKTDTKWVGTDTGLFKSVTNGYALMDITIPGNITSLAYDEKGNMLWIGTNQGLAKASILNGFSVSKIESVNLSNNNISAIHIGSNSSNWVGSILGLSLFRNDKWKKTGIIEESEEYDINNLHISSITNNGSDYYFATKGRRVIHAYGFDESIDAFTGASLLKEPYNGNALADTMNVVFSDSRGRQWMGGPYGIQWHPDVNIKMDPGFYDQFTSNNVHAIAEAPNGDIWVGTEKGIAVYNNTDWSTPNIVLPNPFVTAIVFDKTGTAWIGTKKGLTSIK